MRREGYAARHGGAHQKKATHATLPRPWRAAPAPAIHPHPSTRKLAPRRASPRRAHHHQPRPSHAHTHTDAALRMRLSTARQHTQCRAPGSPPSSHSSPTSCTHTLHSLRRAVWNTHTVCRPTLAARRLPRPQRHARGMRVSRLATPLRHVHTHDLTADPSANSSMGDANSKGAGGAAPAPAPESGGGAKAGQSAKASRSAARAAERARGGGARGGHLAL